MAAPLISLVVLTGYHSAPPPERGRSTAIAITPPVLRRPVSRQTALIFRSIPQHRCDLVEASDAGVHFHRFVEAVGMGGRVAAPAAFAHHDTGKVEVEGCADARLDAAIGGPAADDYRVFLQSCAAHRDLHSFPTRRSSCRVRSTTPGCSTSPW